ncbi:response regulator receiver protein [Candidatus Nitrosarchaeum limnium SFB1]|uniref:Response regulator receiver protein n=1 Tax=Candidatus Nitrosarchaeum limnium SFB1 TaxID=886738 RepID=F3KJX6_9ARCH|nr:response regulator receiver protein [Candidatus Nitrosarchaeum limnium SFB1]
MITAIVIDDDKNTVGVFSEYLELEGIEVIGKGYDGKEAVELYVKLNPDVIFLDVMMDGFDGLYALEKIREINNNANVIMVTADITEDTYKKMTGLKASAIIFKPYEIDALRKVIKDLVYLTKKI